MIKFKNVIYRLFVKWVLLTFLPILYSFSLYISKCNNVDKKNLHMSKQTIIVLKK